MKKQKPRLTLHKETLRTLTELDLGSAGGGRMKRTENERTQTCGCPSDTGTM